MEEPRARRYFFAVRVRYNWEQATRGSPHERKEVDSLALTLRSTISYIEIGDDPSGVGSDGRSDDGCESESRERAGGGGAGAGG